MKHGCFAAPHSVVVTLTILLTVGSASAQVTILTVGPHGTYTQIQDAIDVVVSGDDTEIRVEGASTYVENLDIGTGFSGGTLALLGGWDMTFTDRVFPAQNTIIDGNQAGGVVVGLAQVPKVKLKIPKMIPGLETILKSKPPLTTGISDAVTEVPFLDDFNPEFTRSMSLLPRTSEGSFVLEKPGNYIFEFQSYCLKAGTYAPGEDRGGRGYLYAPLKGPQSDIIGNILKNAYLHPEIPQKDIQVLLWAVISRTKIKNMPPKMKRTAALLLTPKELYRINGGALGLIPEELINKAFADLPTSVRRVMEAEAHLRSMLTRASASYEELERVAVLQGEPPFEEGDREVPNGRWSFHPDGFFIRYFPCGYPQMLIELNLPESIQVEHDAQGRITSISDQRGNSIKTVYSDTVEPLVISGEPLLRGYVFHSLFLERINFEHADPEKKEKKEWKNKGWTLLGIPTGGGQINSSVNHFSDSQKRYFWSLTHKKQLNDLFKGLIILGRFADNQKLSPDKLEEIMALGHYAVALQNAVSSSTAEEEDWLESALNLVKTAWLAAVSKNMSTIEGTPIFDPAEDPVPGQGASQRGGDSPRPTNKTEECGNRLSECMDKAKEKLDRLVKDCLRSDFFDENLCNVDAIAECMLQIYAGDRDISTLNDCIIGANCGGTDELRKCVRSKLGVYHRDIWKCDEAYKKCMN